MPALFPAGFLCIPTRIMERAVTENKKQRIFQPEDGIILRLKHILQAVPMTLPLTVQSIPDLNMIQKPIQIMLSVLQLQPVQQAPMQ